MTYVSIPITEEEKTIIRCLSEGLSQKQVAEKMFLSYKTLERKVIALRGKTGSNNQTHLVAFAYRCGILNATGHQNEGIPK